MSDVPLDAIERLKPLTARLRPVRCSEIVLQTANYERMRDWYQAVLGLPWAVSNDCPERSGTTYPGSPKQVRASDVRASFMFLDPDIRTGQTLAIFEVPGLADAPCRDPGLNHLQFKHADLTGLMARIELLLAAAIKPHRASNHGPITSFYFCDPDLNVVELAINNFPDRQTFDAFVRSERFRRNPSGIELEPEDFVRRYKSGESPDRLLQFP